MKNKIASLIVAAVCLSLISCSHSLNIKNSKTYLTTPNFSPIEKPLNIGFTDVSGNADQLWCCNAIIEKLAAKPFIGMVQSNYSLNQRTSSEREFVPDYVISIEPDIEFKGSGWNYPITFPGFLVFAHAWNGYKYSANIDTKITIRDANGNLFKDFTVSTPYKFNHCDFGRGFWSSSGWWTPGLGALNSVLGFFMIRYDKDATDDFYIHVKDNYSTYVVEKVVEAIVS